MKKVLNLAFVCVFIVALSIPTSTFATYGHNDSNKNFFESIINKIFNGNKEAQHWADNDSKNKWDKDWDGCYKKGSTCQESIDIWRDCYGGKEKDKHKGKEKHNGHKENYVWQYEKGNSWDKWTWW